VLVGEEELVGAEPHWAGSDFQQPPRDDGGVALCGSCRRTGTCRLGLTTERLDADGVASFDLVCSIDNEGGPRVAHGGWTAGVLDEVLGHVPLLHGQLTVTGTLEVRFVAPVPIERPLQARAWIDRVDGAKWYLSGELLLASSGALLARATGVWIARVGRDHFSRFEAWLADQEIRGEQDVTRT
jgi:acyl-coenzyme A thioesterase PaaI-like protein